MHSESVCVCVCRDKTCVFLCCFILFWNLAFGLALWEFILDFNLFFFLIILWISGIVAVVLVNVRYVQEALTFKLHFNSRLNAEATCEKCLHMCSAHWWRFCVCWCRAVAVAVAASAEIALPFTWVECRISFEHCLYKCTDVPSVRFGCRFWGVDCLFSAGEWWMVNGNKAHTQKKN